MILCAGADAEGRGTRASFPDPGLRKFQLNFSTILALLLEILAQTAQRMTLSMLVGLAGKSRTCKPRAILVPTTLSMSVQTAAVRYTVTITCPSTIG
jgi:hypothetical protein